MDALLICLWCMALQTASRACIGALARVLAQDMCRLRLQAGLHARIDSTLKRCETQTLVPALGLRILPPAVVANAGLLSPKACSARAQAHLDIRLLAGLHLQPLVGRGVAAGGGFALPHLVHARRHVRQARQQVLDQVRRVMRRLRHDA